MVPTFFNWVIYENFLSDTMSESGLEPVFQPRTLSSITAILCRRIFFPYLGPIFFPPYSGYTFYQTMMFIAHLLISQHLLIAHQTCKDDGKATVSEIKLVASNLRLVCPQVSWKMLLSYQLTLFCHTFPLSLNSTEPLPQFFYPLLLREVVWRQTHSLSLLSHPTGPE